MSWLESLGLFARAPDLRESSAIESDIADELEFHLAERAREFEQHGHAPNAARALAEQRFGPRDRIERQCRQIQMGERIMLQRINLVLVLVLLAALIALGWNFTQNQRELRAAVDGLSQSLVKKHVSGEPAPAASEVESPEQIAWREWKERVAAAGDGAAALGEEIAALDTGEALTRFQYIYPLLHAPAARRRLLEPFVRGAGHVYAISMLDPAARDSDVELRTWALRQLESYALRDFVAEPLAYPEWREAFLDRPIREVLEHSAVAFGDRVLARRGNDLARELALFDRVRFEPAESRGIDLRREIRFGHEGQTFGSKLAEQAMAGAYDDALKPKLHAFLQAVGEGAYGIFEVKPK